MRRTLAILGIVITGWFSGTAFSQTAGPVLPAGPLIAPAAPDYSQWTVDCTYPEAENQKASQAKYQAVIKQLESESPEMAAYLASQPTQSMTPRQVQKISVVKTGETKQEIFWYPAGKRRELWTTRAAAVLWDSFVGRYILQAKGPMPKSQDFPEFGWISAQNFTGIKVVKGKECLIFEDRVDPVMVDDPQEFKDSGGSGSSETLASAVAVINLENRLPVRLLCGSESREYTFSTPPASPLVVPPEFAEAVRKVDKQIKATELKLSRP